MTTLSFQQQLTIEVLLGLLLAFVILQAILYEPKQ